MRERIKEQPAPEIIEYLFKPGISNDMERSYATILAVNAAHVIMLMEEKIITRDVCQKILAVTKAMALAGKPEFEINYNLEDLYFNMEAYLIKAVGLEVGGQQHTGRSRNDMIATIIRMDSRDYFLKICSMVNGLRAALLAFAQEHASVVMSGYTHLQPSEPITMGHYFAAILYALDRDYQRIINAYGRLNICPLGSGAMASTSFKINRETTAQLLGFDDYMGNSLDGVASRDYVLEIEAAFGIMMNNLSRMAHDLYLWSTPEYGYIEVGGSVAACSSIMPQKKNPMTLEHIKAKAAHVEAFFVSAFSALKNTPFTHARDISCEAVSYYYPALKEVEAAVQLATVTIKTIKVNQEIMLERAKNNFCTVTELANYLVRYEGISFRAAHEVVAEIVAYMLEHKKSSEDISPEILAEIALNSLGLRTTLTKEQIANALNPVLNARAKDVAGGPAPREVEKQLVKLSALLARDQKELAAQTERVALAKIALQAKVDDIAGN
ncbi:argininosuccinate lyase [Sporomusa termitida]|uniref:Argininosuccinate lyase n=1 Tax=Sporomusa termitida TaxID=2377 RepID=A0A517DR14_9FIRM|nr:argininosuccinate lyase [Sporomusa termitida]QDR79790.1 Argininosuccinate lyase [Sporomusa termitida]